MTSTKRSPELVDRDAQILNRLARIEHKVDSLDQTTAFALRAESAKHQESVRLVFTKSRRRAQVYLAADGSRTVQGIAKFLSMKNQNVSRELKVLKEEGLLELAETSGAGDVYAKKAVDKTLRISRFLCETYGLQASGLQSKKVSPSTKRR